MPAILGGGFPLPATPKGLEKGHSFNSITRWIKTMIDGGILVHEPVLQVNSKSTCAVMPRDRLVKMCSSRGEQIPSVLDKYLSPRYSTSTFHLGTRQVPLTSVLDKYLSPRYSTSTSHLGTRQVPFTIDQIRSDQVQRKSGTELLKHGAFKEVFPCFLI